MTISKKSNEPYVINYCDKCNRYTKIKYIVNNITHPIPYNKLTPNGNKLKCKDTDFVMECECESCGEKYKIYVRRYKYEND